MLVCYCGWMSFCISYSTNRCFVDAEKRKQDFSSTGNKFLFYTYFESWFRRMVWGLPLVSSNTPYKSELGIDKQCWPAPAPHYPPLPTTPEHRSAVARNDTREHYKLPDREEFRLLHSTANSWTRHTPLKNICRAINNIFKLIFHEAFLFSLLPPAFSHPSSST